jgi:hypothetical protein
VPGRHPVIDADPVIDEEPLFKFGNHHGRCDAPLLSVTVQITDKSGLAVVSHIILTSLSPLPNVNTILVGALRSVAYHD